MICDASTQFVLKNPDMFHMDEDSNMELDIAKDNYCPNVDAAAPTKDGVFFPEDYDVEHRSAGMCHSAGFPLLTCEVGVQSPPDGPSFERFFLLASQAESALSTYTAESETLRTSMVSLRTEYETLLKKTNIQERIIHELRRQRMS
eukprot:TRINITY_DN42381_c0_g1_i1.p1 TRINITY_DN42381_c0_g1~~TRINITY_DN42381_c0_g1_i1.p1  ORF type:complete len:146 (+),score=21.35 TRINITY_DN42381_c0_g1_i1:458-895(+)